MPPGMPGGPGGGGGGGTLLDEMKEKGSLLTGDYAVQFRKVLEKTYGNANQALSVTLNPMDTMALMSGLIQSMMVKDKHPFETASTFNLTSMPKTAPPEATLGSMLNYGQNMLLAQQQLVGFMKDLLGKTAAKSAPRTDSKGEPGSKVDPATDGKKGAAPGSKAMPGSGAKTLPASSSKDPAGPAALPGALPGDPPGAVPGAAPGGDAATVPKPGSAPQSAAKPGVAPSLPGTPGPAGVTGG